MLILGVLFAEYGCYYFVSHISCRGWPDNLQNESAATLRLMLIADTHIMGPVKSVWIDKTRREWQMKQAFQIFKQTYRPDVIVFLGDLFDEGSFSRDDTFKTFHQDFQRIFHLEPEEKRIIIPGNHDVGWHDTMVTFPYLLDRFSELYRTTKSLGIINPSEMKHLNLLVANSMSFHNDTCNVCSTSLKATNSISSELSRKRHKYGANFSSPILFHHIPLFRADDGNCDLADKTTRINREGQDVLHRSSSQFILEKLDPRLVISGHTHMHCRTKHTFNNKTYEEMTISSFNHKYAESKAGFGLLSLDLYQTKFRHCYLLDEWVLILTYMLTLFIIITRFITWKST